MAPEILLERRYEASADLWSIGCILYECLFGWAPYRSKTIEELLIKVKTEQSIDLRGATKLTAPCKDLLARLLVHDPAKRIAFGDFFSHEFLDMEHEPTDEVGSVLVLHLISSLIVRSIRIWPRPLSCSAVRLSWTTANGTPKPIHAIVRDCSSWCRSSVPSQMS